MDWETLKASLIVDGGEFCLKPEILTTSVDAWLGRFFENSELSMRKATKEVGTDKVTICGQSQLFHIDSAAVRAEFSVCKDGEVCVVLVIEPDAQSWSLAQSFPDIPCGEKHPFSGIKYSKCSLILTNRYAADYEGYELYDGINFRGVISASPLMTALGHTWSVYPVIYGHINIDRMTSPEPLSWGDFPFMHDSADKPLPGFVFTVEIQDYASFTITDSVKVNQVGMRLYCPPNKQFTEDNPTYFTYTALHGTVSIPELGIEQDCWINYVPNDPTFQLINKFKGLSVGNLAKLACLCGGKNVEELLPSTFKPLGDLQLTELGIGFTLSGDVPGISYVSITIGMPNTEWEILDGKLSVGQLSCTFTYRPGADDGESKFGVSIAGVVTIDEKYHVAVRADNENGFTLYLDTLDSIKIPLSDVLSKYWSIEAPMVIDVDSVSCEISPANHAAVAIRMASDGDGWHIPIGPKEFVLSDIAMFFSYVRSDKELDAETQYSGSISGTIAFTERLRLSASFAYPSKSVAIRMNLPDFSLREFIKAVGGDESFLPNAFNIKLTQSMVLFEKEQTNYRLKMATLVNDFGLLTFEFLSGSGGKGFIFGVNIDGNRLGNFFRLGDLDAFNVFTLEQLVLIVSTTALNDYSFPGTEEFDVPALEGLTMNNPAGGKLVEGINFMAKWKIDTKDATQKMLQKLLDINVDMAVVLQIGLNEVYRLYAEMDGEISNHPVSVKVGAEYSGGNLAFFVAGSITVNIQGTEQKFTLEIGVTLGGAYGSGTMESGLPLKFGILQIANLAIQLGVSWEGVPSFGIAGNITLGGDLNSSIAVLFDSENPARSMIAGSVSNFTLADVFDAFLPDDCRSKQLAEESINDVREVLSWFGLSGTNAFNLSTNLADALDNVQLEPIAAAFSEHGITIPTDISRVYFSVGDPGNHWFIGSLDANRPRYYEVRREIDKESGKEVLRAYTEAQFYMVPEDTRIGALEYAQGFYLNGRITIKDFFIEAEVDIRKDRFSVRAEMSKIELGDGILCVSGVNDDKKTPSDKGPVLIIQSDEEPYAYIDAYVAFYSFRGALTGIANKDGFDFDFSVDGTLGSAAVSAGLRKNDGFHIAMAATLEPFLFTAVEYLGYRFDVNLETNASAAVSLSIDKDSGVQTEVSASYVLLGERHDIGSFKLSITPKEFDDIAKAVLNEIKKDILGLLSEAEMFAKMVLGHVINGIRDLEKAIEELFHKTYEEAKEIIEKADELLHKVCAMESAVAELPGK